MPFKQKALLAAIALSSVQVSAVYAQESNKVEEVVVTASRVPIPLRQIAVSVSVVTENDIDAHGNLALTDVLRQLPGIATSSNGGAGKTTTLRIRGEEGFRTLTIFDGMRLSDPSGTQISSPMEHLMTSGITRVEVLRGPQGLSYGADAGGIINISSRQSGTGLRGGVDVQTGRYDTNQYSGNLSGGNDKVDFFVSASDFETNGFNTSTADTVLRDNDGYDNTTLHGRIGVNITDNLRAELVHRDVSGTTMFDGCYLTSTVHDCVATYDLNATRGALEYKSAAFSHSLSYSTTKTDRDNLSVGVSTFKSKGELNRWEYVGSATDLPGFDVVFGGDVEEDKNGSVGRDNVGYFAEYLSDFSDAWHFTAGARYDDNDAFGTNTSYRVSAAYLYDLANNDTLKFKSSYGTGFRAPSPYEISYNTGPYSYPPASLVKLQQERSKGFEIGVEYLTKRNLHLEAVYFDQQVEDAIYFDLSAYSGYLQDFGSSTSKGVELSAELGLTESLDLRANYTYDDTKRPNGLPRLRRPENLTNLGLSWHGLSDKLSVNAFYRISKDSIDAVGATSVPLDNFEVLDLSASYDFTDNIQVYGRVENALNEKYKEIAGYNTAGAAAYIGFRMHFSSL